MGRSQLQGVCILDVDCCGVVISGVPVTANRETVLEDLRDKWVDGVCVCVPGEDTCAADLIRSVSQMGIPIHMVTDRLETIQTYSIVTATAGELLLKRIVDIVGGAVGCILTGFLALIVGPVIFFQSPGPVFFTQTRIGRNGKRFKLYKFRSMHPDAEARKPELLGQNRFRDGRMFRVDFDPRIIGCEKLPDGTIRKGIGNLIRDWHLDEFPQFWNVLKGDMSLCGTRPPTVDEWNRYDLHHRARLAMKPGITGLWQISGRDDITDFEQVVRLDIKYIKEWSMGLDLRILLCTVKFFLSGHGSMLFFWGDLNGGNGGKAIKDCHVWTQADSLPGRWD